MDKRWYTPGSSPGLWGTDGTYGAVDYDDLPPIDRSRHDGTFGWLAEEPETHGLLFGNDEDNLPDEDQIAERAGAIVAAAEDEGLVVPPAFRALFADPEKTYLRIPSCTSCYLDLGQRLTEIDGEPGRFLRFLNDQQCVLVWGLHLRPDGSHQVLVAEPEFLDDTTGDHLEDVARFAGHQICADDLEEFIHRFWIENAIWFRQRSGELTPEMETYVAHARGRVARR